MTHAEALTRYFYDWEERGRGWFFADAPIELEPPFVPFNPPSFLSNRERIDDGRHPTLLQLIGKKIAAAFKPKEIAPVPPSVSLSSVSYADYAPFVVLTVSLSSNLDLSGFEAEQLLLMLSYCRYPLSFELVGRKGRLSIQFTCRETDAPYVESQFRTLYPSCTVLRSADALEYLRTSGMDTLLLDLGLEQEFMRPLAVFDRRAPSPYLGLAGILDVLSGDECACIQVLFQGANRPWPASIMRSVTDARGHSFFMDAPEMPGLAEEKVVIATLRRGRARACSSTRVSDPENGRDHEALSACLRRADGIAVQLAHTLVHGRVSGKRALCGYPEPSEQEARHAAQYRRACPHGPHTG